MGSSGRSAARKVVAGGTGARLALQLHNNRQNISCKIVAKEKKV
jgi:hypothetical protein